MIMSDNTNTAGIFGKLFGRKNTEKEPTPQERAAKLIESYQLDPTQAQPLVDKLSTFEEAADKVKSDSKADIDNANKLVEQAQKKQIEADNLVKAAKAVGLRSVTLAKEVKAAKIAAEEAKTKAQAEVEALAKTTDEAKTLGNDLIKGLTDPRLDLDALLNLTDEEVESLFGTEPKEAPKAPEKQVKEPKEAPKAAPKVTC